MANLVVSAVVTAHDRRAFLPHAIRSAFDAGADEVVVVRNFSDPIDSVPARFTDVLCAHEETGVKQAVGVETARGDVVAFLDDDDMWVETKVARVREVFQDRLDLVYYCHGQTSMDAAGRPAVAHHTEYAGRDPGQFSQWDSREVDALFDRLWPGNNSSTSVRRSWATGWTPILRQVGWGADRFWMAAALLDAKGVLLEGSPLAQLRLHDQNMSHARNAPPSEFRRRHALSSSRFARACGELARVARERAGPNAPITRHFQQRAVAFGFFRDLESGVRPRRAAAHALTAGPGWRDRSVLGASLVTLAFPGAARWLLYRSSRRRWALGSGAGGPGR